MRIPLRFLWLCCLFFSEQSWALPATIPLSVEESKIFLPCQFDAYKTRCLLDSGSNFSSVKSPLFDDYAAVGRMNYNGGTGREIHTDKIVVHHLALAELHLEEWPVARMPKLSRYFNLIGLDVFARVPLLFDFKNLKIVVDAPRPPEAQLQPYTMQLGMILLPVKIGDTSLEAVWDTGASTTVIDQDFIATHPDNFTYMKEVEAKDASGTRMVMKLYKIKKLQIASVLLKGTSVLAMDFSGMRQVHPHFPAFFLGYNVLMNHRWYFNLAHYQWMFS